MQLVEKDQQVVTAYKQKEKHLPNLMKMMMTMMNP
jgi:hypothetical protein